MKYHCIARHLTTAAVALTAFASAAQDKNAAAIKELEAGKRDTAMASWWGFDPVDSTHALQAAIDSGAVKVVVEDLGKPWIVDKIHAASNQEIVFEKGVVVEAKKGAFHGTNDALINIQLKENVTLTGYGATLRMHRADYDSEAYKKAEWRHVLNIRSSSNVRVYGLTLAESGGDGIYLGVAKAGVTNKDIHIKDVVCDRNYRQGISVISAENLLIEDCILRDTSGTPPAAGIDFEPNRPNEKLVNCVMRNCVSENNQGCGYVFYIPNLNGTSAPLSVRLENCIARGSNRVPFSFTASNGRAGGPQQGLAEFVDCTFADGKGPAVSVRSNPAAGSKLRFVNCRLTNVAADTADSVIAIMSRSGDTENVGNIEFENCTIEDAAGRPVLKYADWTGELDLVNVTGALSVKRGDAQPETIELTPDYVAALHTGKRYQRIAKYDAEGVTFRPLNADALDAAPTLRPFSLRKTGTFVLYARQGDRVTFELAHLQVGKYGGRTIKIAAFSPSGKRLPAGEVPYKDRAVLSFEAPETGLYRIPINAGANRFQMLAASHPACVHAEPGGIRFISALGDFYVYVPPGTREFGVKIRGEGQGEAVGATICDPHGAQVWTQPAITLPEQFVATAEQARAGGVWKVTFAKPVGITMEDFYIQLQGIPPFLSCNPDTLLKPAE